MKLCECGCGQPTSLSKTTDSEFGSLKGQPNRFVHGHNNRGAGAYNWKGGDHHHERGYRKVYAPNHPKAYRGRVYEHILIAERALGRSLPPQAVIHHVNGITSDNRPGNLVICENQGYHRLLHERARRLYGKRTRKSRQN